MAKKRGEVEIQFNWILILVAGALIFLFFFGIIRWISSNSEASDTASLSMYLDSILTSSSITKDTTEEVNLNFKQLQFDCKDGRSSYRVDKSAKAFELNNKIVFAPSRIEKGPLVLWTLGWDVPFRVTNFLYVSSPKIRYIIVGDPSNEFVQFLNKSFPDKLSVEYYDNSNSATPNLDDQNNYKVRFVYVGINPDMVHALKFSKMASIDVTAVKIYTENSKDKVAFYRKNPSGFSDIGSPIDVQGKALLSASIFSEDPADFTCARDKALERYKQLAKIYIKRSTVLAGSLTRPSCNLVHTTATSILTNTLTPLLNPNPISLSDQNYIAQQNSCPLIY